VACRAAVELTSGDLGIVGSEHCSDDRDQLVSWEDDAQSVETYGYQVGITADPVAFVPPLKAQLTEAIRPTAAAFPRNTAVTLTDGEPVLHRLEKQPEPEGFALIDRLMRERMPECRMVDVLTDTEHWRHWTAGRTSRSMLRPTGLPGSTSHISRHCVPTPLIGP
jgi:hypothetical protein